MKRRGVKLLSHRLLSRLSFYSRVLFAPKELLRVHLLNVTEITDGQGQIPDHFINSGHQPPTTMDLIFQ